MERDDQGRTAAITTPRGITANLDGKGRVTSIRDSRGNTIRRGPGGERRVESVRADRSRVVSFGRRAGYVERAYNRGGRPYVQRTYVVGGRSFVRVYRGYYYHGVPYYVYVPPFYYAPAYYRWIFTPWPAPVRFTWGWYASPWYNPYRYYFAPYPVYLSPSLWLTDYVLAEDLRLAYEAEALDALGGGSDRKPVQQLVAFHPGNSVGLAAEAPDSPSLTPQVKQLIADEIKSVIADQERAASSPSLARNKAEDEKNPPALDPNHRVFVVFSVLDVVTDGEACSLTAGDLVQKMQSTLGKDDALAVKVLASKKGDCRTGSSVRIPLADLNDMQNRLREQVDAGLKTLADTEGREGLPSGPAADPRAVPEGTAEPDASAVTALQQQEQEADQAEREIQQEEAADSIALN